MAPSVPIRTCKASIGPERLERRGPCWLLQTEVNGDSKSTKKRGPCVPVQEIFVLPWLLVGPVQNNFFLTVHFFNSFVPIAQQAGQAAMLGFLSLSYVSLYSTDWYISTAGPWYGSTCWATWTGRTPWRTGTERTGRSSSYSPSNVQTWGGGGVAQLGPQGIHTAN